MLHTWGVLTGVVGLVAVVVLVGWAFFYTRGSCV